MKTFASPAVATGGTSMAEIDLDRITKVYPNGFLAVDELTLSLADGEFLVLVGPSGCGKSTVLRMIAGLESITRGELRIGGEVMNLYAPRDRDIAMVFQDYALYPHMTAAENMAFPLKLAGVPKAERSRLVADAAGVLELREYLDSKPALLSGGQRQRVAMGRASGTPAVGLPDGRAAVEPGRKVAGADASRDRVSPASTGRDHVLCHPRSSRGHDDGRSGSRDQGTVFCSRSTRPRHSMPPRGTSLWLRSSGLPSMNLFEARLTREVD